MTVDPTYGLYNGKDARYKLTVDISVHRGHPWNLLGVVLKIPLHLTDTISLTCIDVRDPDRAYINIGTNAGGR